MNGRSANEDWHSLRRLAPFGDSDLIEFASCRGLLSVIQISKEVVFWLYVTGHFLSSREKVWSFIKRILIQNGLYKNEDLKSVHWKRVSTCWWVCPIDGQYQREKYSVFWEWKPPSPKRRHWGDGIRTEKIGTSLMTWNYMPGWALQHSNLSRFLFLIIPACSEDPIVLSVIKLIRILQTWW